MAKRLLAKLSRTRGHGSCGQTANGTVRRSRRWIAPVCEALDPRRLLSSAPDFHPTFVIYQPSGITPDAASEVSPSQMRHAYGADSISVNGIVGNGSGQTIGIVDAYEDPTLTTDIATFDSDYGLTQFNAGAPTLSIIRQDGSVVSSNNEPPADPKGPGDSWAVETSLDLEWAHVMAPQANVVVVMADNSGNGLFTAVTTAADYPGVSAVSMSWGGTGLPQDSLFDVTGVTFVAASGDAGSNGGTIYPSTSPNVIGVGGTTLLLSGGNYSSESGWSGSGGGLSSAESEPSYQQGVVPSSITTSERAVPDVAMDANPSSGVPVIDSYDFGNSNPRQVGGTSLATPMFAALMAVTNQERVAAGEPKLNTSGPTEAATALYLLSESGNFHDITSGNNGAYSCLPGYDLVTGRGTPVENVMVPALTAPPAPVIGSFSVSPTTVLSGNPATLTAAYVAEAGGTIGSVNFYRESNGTSGLQIGSDTLVGAGTQSGTTWTLSTSTTGFAFGTYTYYAVATDNNGISTVASATLAVTVPPTIGAFSVSPISVVAGGSTTLTAANVTETGGTISNVNFYRESNGTSGLQVGSDTSLSAGTQSGATWTLATSTAALGAGTYTYYAVATDSAGVTSVASATLTVTPAPPLANIQVLASASPTGPYTNTLTATPGQTVYYEVTGQLAPVGTTNSAGAKSYTITSETAHPGVATTGYDGIQSVSFTLSDSGAFTGSFGSATLSPNPSTGDNWGAETGATAGTAGGTTVTGVEAGLPAGVFGGATSPEPILTGAFVVPANAPSGATSTIAGIYAGGFGGLAIDSTPSTGLHATKIALSSGDPYGYFGFAPLGLTVAPSFPAWLASTSNATWNAATHLLTVTGPSTIIADPGNDEPLIVASGAASQLTIQPTASDVDVHVGGITLTGGAGVDVATVGTGRGHGNHNILVIGQINAANDPMISIDSSSTLNLEGNDLIVHTGISDAGGHAGLAAVEAMAETGRAGGAWNGKGLTSTAAENQDQSDGLESVQLAVVDNADLGTPFGAWQVGSAVETLGASDIIVKYTYTGDFNLDGLVNFQDTAVLGLNYNAGASTGNEWAFGDTNGDGLLNFLDSANFGLDFGNGTAAGLDTTQL